jgi:aminomethyltransferase
MVVLFDRTSAQGRIELSDRDRLDLLHRMSTNDLNGLPPGHARQSVLTTALARIIDLVTVFNRGENALMLTHYPATTRAWLQKHIFWNDRLKLRDASGELGQIELHGSGAARVMARVAGEAATELPLFGFIEVEIQSVRVLVARVKPLDGEGFVILTPDAPGLTATLADGDDVRMGDAARYDLMRITAGQPGAGSELTEDFIPLEAGLWEAVSFSKGCYIGQEIIARMESRNKLAKTLVQVVIRATHDDPAHNATLTNIKANALQITPDGASGGGPLTSAARREDGTWIGLGFLRPDAAELAAGAGEAARIMRGDVQIATARVMHIAGHAK